MQDKGHERERRAPANLSPAMHSPVARHFLSRLPFPRSETCFTLDLEGFSSNTGTARVKSESSLIPPPLPLPLIILDSRPSTSALSQLQGHPEKRTGGFE